MSVSVESAGLPPVGSGGTPAGTPNGASIAGVGSVASPAANGVIVNLGSIVIPTNMQVEITAWTTGGAPAAADINNLALTANGATILAVGLPASATPVPAVTRARIAQSGTFSCTLKAVGAATAGVTYCAIVSITPVV